MAKPNSMEGIREIDNPQELAAVEAEMVRAVHRLEDTREDSLGKLGGVRRILFRNHPGSSLTAQVEEVLEWLGRDAIPIDTIRKRTSILVAYARKLLGKIASLEKEKSALAAKLNNITNVVSTASEQSIPLNQLSRITSCPVTLAVEMQARIHDVNGTNVVGCLPFRMSDREAVLLHGFFPSLKQAEPSQVQWFFIGDPPDVRPIAIIRDINEVLPARRYRVLEFRPSPETAPMVGREKPMIGQWHNAGMLVGKAGGLYYLNCNLTFAEQLGFPDTDGGKAVPLSDVARNSTLAESIRRALEEWLRDKVFGSVKLTEADIYKQATMRLQGNFINVEWEWLGQNYRLVSAIGADHKLGSAFKKV